MTSLLATGRWTAHEKQLFLEAHDKHGRNWVAIAKAVGTRTPTPCVAALRSRARARWPWRLTRDRHTPRAVRFGRGARGIPQVLFTRAESLVLEGFRARPVDGDADDYGA